MKEEEHHFAIILLCKVIRQNDEMKKVKKVILTSIELM
jgi:hypothetical protein